MYPANLVPLRFEGAGAGLLRDLFSARRPFPSEQERFVKQPSKRTDLIAFRRVLCYNEPIGKSGFMEKDKMNETKDENRDENGVSMAGQCKQDSPGKKKFFKKKIQ